MPIIDILLSSGPLISGAGLLGTCAAAWYTAVRVTNRNAAKDRAQREEAERQRAVAARKDSLARATKTFQILYTEIWVNSDVSYVRRCIYNDEEYKDIEHILEKRNLVEHNNLTRQENNIIEKVDRFCSILVRVKSFAANEEMSDRQRRLWKKLLEDFWLTKIKDRRAAFYTYIRNHWPELDEQESESEPSVTSVPSAPIYHHANLRRLSSRRRRIFQFVPRQANR